MADLTLLHLFQKAAQSDACIVDESVQPAALRENPADHRFAFRGLCDVQLDRGDAQALRCFAKRLAGRKIA